MMHPEQLDEIRRVAIENQKGNDGPAAACQAEDTLLLLAEVDRLHTERITSVVMSHHRDAPRPFVLYRRTDATGVSGTGVVAEGCAFNDGSAVLRWLSDWPTSVVFHDRGIEAIETVHGHNGATQVVWVSEELEPLADMEQQRDEARAEVERLNAEHGPQRCTTVDEVYTGVSVALNERDEARAEVERLTAERDAYAKAKQENDDRFMRERDEARAEVARLITERNEYVAKKVDQINELAGEVERLRDEVATLDKGMNELDHENERLRGQLDRARAIAGRIDYAARRDLAVQEADAIQELREALGERLGIELDEETGGIRDAE